MNNSADTDFTMPTIPSATDYGHFRANTALTALIECNKVKLLVHCIINNPGVEIQIFSLGHGISRHIK